MGKLAQNGVWVVAFFLLIDMHLFGRGHGGRGGCCGGDDQRPEGGEQPGKDKPQGHQH